MSKDAQRGYRQRLHALDLQSGVEQLGGPVEIAAPTRMRPRSIRNSTPSGLRCC
jgi:hypothetical protein